MTNVILRRTMFLEEGTRQLQIEIDLPYSHAPDEFVCEYRIIDGPAISLEAIHGSDSIQTVMIAFDAIRDALFTQFPTARWHDLPIELAFPRPIPYIAGIDIYKDIEKFASDYLAGKGF